MYSTVQLYKFKFCFKLQNRREFKECIDSMSYSYVLNWLMMS